MRGIHTLPAPTWVQSDNNLLPKWRRYLEWHSSHFGDEEITRLTERNQQIDHELVQCFDTATTCKRDVAEKRQKLKQFEDLGLATDEAIMESYKAIIANPNVLGTRIDGLGALVVLVDPIVPGAEDHDFGLFEISIDTYLTGYVQMPVMADGMFDALRGRYEMHIINRELGLYSVQFGRDTDATQALALFDVGPAIEDAVGVLKSFYNNYARHRLYKKDANRQRTIPWSGPQVVDPVQALKRLQLLAGSSVEKQIETLKYEIARYQRSVVYYQDLIRDYRKERRENEALIQQRKATLTNHVVDVMEAARSLSYITSLPGVIGIRFDTEGVPVLHVRNSTVYYDRRYDLGDFELSLKTETPHFGTVLFVKRTRVPLGGSYDAGWHNNADAFCFGNRNEEIMSAFYAGDLMHAVNVAIGTMNAVNWGTIMDGYFAEISPGAVWVNRRRKRSRRKTHAQQVAA